MEKILLKKSDCSQIVLMDPYKFCVDNTKCISIKYVPAPAPVSPQVVVKKLNSYKQVSISCEISGNKIFDNLRVAIDWLVSTCTRLSVKEIKELVQIKKQKSWKKIFKKECKKLQRLIFKKTLKQIRELIKKALELLKRKGFLPKDLKELVLGLLKLHRLLKWLYRQYTFQLTHLMLFIAIFDQMRFRNMTNILDAFYARKWKVFFHLLTNFLRVPLVMLVVSLIRRDHYAGGTALAFALPLFFFAKFRVPFLTNLLEVLFSEIFPPEAIPIGTHSAQELFYDPFRARRLLERLVDKSKK